MDSRVHDAVETMGAPPKYLSEHEATHINFMADCSGFGEGGPVQRIHLEVFMIPGKTPILAGIGLACWISFTAAPLGFQQAESVPKPQAPIGWGKIRLGMTPQEVATIFNKKLPKKFERLKETGTIRWGWLQLQSDVNCGLTNGIPERSTAGAAFTADAVTQLLKEITYFPNECRTTQQSRQGSMLREIAWIFEKQHGPPMVVGDKMTWTLQGAYIEVFPDYHKTYSGTRPAEYIVGVTIRKLDN